MNRVELIGVLLWPVELRRNRDTGGVVGKAAIAVSNNGKRLDFVPVTLQREDALDAARYLGEGSRVHLIGRLASGLLVERDESGCRQTRRVVRVLVDSITYIEVEPPRGGERQ